MRALLSVAAADEGYYIKERKSLADRIIINCHATHLRWKQGGLWLLNNGFCKTLDWGSNARSHFVTCTQKG